MSRNRSGGILKLLPQSKGDINKPIKIFDEVDKEPP